MRIPGSVIVFVNALALVSAGCGARSGLLDESAGGSSSEPPLHLPPGVAPPTDGCSAPLPVPAGYAALGFWALDEQGDPFIDSCAQPVPTRAFMVAGVFLDRDEVTNRCYRSCVGAGACSLPIAQPDAPAWDDPERTGFAVSLERDQAAEFCAFRGGRLPTLAELTRAMQGDAVQPVPPDLLDPMASCVANGYPQECAPLFDRIYAPYPQEAVSSNAADVGPFGHHDLLFGQFEPTLTQPTNGVDSSASFCALPPDAPAPTTFNESPAFDYLYLWFAPADSLAIGLVGGPGLWHAASYVTITPEHAEPTRMRQGVRCAYDPAKP
jgi:hypothetical protein